MVAKKKRQPKWTQRTFDSLLHGGFRPGAGRKKREGSGVPHDMREDFKASTPLHVTLKLREGLEGLRRDREFEVVCRCLEKGKEKPDFRVVHFAVLSNHLHLIIEADGKQSLARGVQGLSVRIAKALNKLWSRSGSIFAGRYHAVLLKSPNQARNALAYVLDNARQHGVRLRPGELDPCSSAALFDGWDCTPLRAPTSRILALVARARCWLLRKGWRHDGPLPLPL